MSSKSVVNLWSGDNVRMPSGDVGQVRRWLLHRNAAFGLPDERVAEVVLRGGRVAQFSERLMAQAEKLEA